VRRRKLPTGFWRINPNKRDHLEALTLSGRIILKWILKIVSGGGGKA
jgi:hypothetical protein